MPFWQPSCQRDSHAGHQEPKLENYQPGRKPLIWWAFTSATEDVAVIENFLGGGDRMLFIIEGVGVNISCSQISQKQKFFCTLPRTCKLGVSPKVCCKITILWKNSTECQFDKTGLMKWSNCNCCCSICNAVCSADERAC